MSGHPLTLRLVVSRKGAGASKATAPALRLTPSEAALIKAVRRLATQQPNAVKAIQSFIHEQLDEADENPVGFSRLQEKIAVLEGRSQGGAALVEKLADEILKDC